MKRALVSVIAAALAVLAFGASTAPAITPVSCPSFRVLHDDRIGPASLPAGSYRIETAPAANLTCAAAAKLFARFLEDFDGNLPAPWRVVAQASGRASFNQGGKAGFSVSLTGGGGGGGGGGNRALGALCRASFMVNSNVLLGPLTFRKGEYLLYIPAGSGIACERAATLFTRLLSSPGGRLPAPWRLEAQTATFFKPAHPVRSSFRVEPLAGSGGTSAGAGPA
ncbi:MAG TPA: hypothetical protein VFX85_06835 [Solirubrobacterales bacterium]|nr:hypothetical protein [Solirubrobacterales bacterium]